MFDTAVYNEGSKFKFNVDAVSGTLHKSVRKVNSVLEILKMICAFLIMKSLTLTENILKK